MYLDLDSLLEMSSNRSPLWQFFSISAFDKKFVVCNFCDANISRGSEDPKKQTTSGMKTHMLSKHPFEYKEHVNLTQATSSQTQQNLISTHEESRKENSIFNIRSKRQRTDLLRSMSIILSPVYLIHDTKNIFLKINHIFNMPDLY